MFKTIGLVWPLPLIAVGIVGIVDPVSIAIALILAVIPLVKYQLSHSKSVRLNPTTTVALVLFVASAVIGLSAAYNPILSLPVLLVFLGSVSLFFAFISTPFSRWRVGSGLVLIASLFALYYVSQYAYFDYPTEVGLPARLGRITGSLAPKLVLFTPHPNAVAGFLEGTVLLSIMLVRRTQGPKRWIWGACAAFIAYGLLISGSRGAWSGLVVAAGLWTLLHFRGRALSWSGATFGVMAGLLAGFYMVGQVGAAGQQIPLLGGWLNTASSRLTLYQNSFHLLQDYLFTGIGPGGTFSMVYSRYQLMIQVPFLHYAHNLLLSIGLGQGLLGLVTAVWLMLSFYYFVVQVERVELDERSRTIFRSAWLGLTVILVHGLTDSVQFSEARWTLPVPFALAGLAVTTGKRALTRAQRGVVDKEVSWSDPLDRQRIILVAVILLLLASIGLVFWRPVVSALQANLGAIYQARADISTDLDDAAREAAQAQAVRHFERALQINPFQPVANRRLGMLALDRQEFETAVSYLERAYQKESDNQATLKTLGYAYLWTGQLALAEQLFKQVEYREFLVGELRHWQRSWEKQNRADLSTCAREMGLRLKVE